ncbi:MAG: PEP-CTERM sorting domain-containing protein [Thiobacillaceae bacterium]|jgi:hypothetical protein|nr:PEP-CTERM sorting domain-containing protein [Thiobacillaceae bacterium]
MTYITGTIYALSMPYQFTWGKIMNKSIVALALATASVTASAAPVSIWDYVISTQWSSAAFEFAGGGTSQNSSLLSWGGAGGSSLEILNSPTKGQIWTGGAAVGANTIAHTNNVIWSDFAALSSGAMRVNVGLEASPYWMPYDVSLSYLFNFKFVETANNGACDWSNGNANTGNNCDDIFVFSGDTSQSFSYAGENYVASLGFDNNFIALSTSDCAKFSFGAGCYALITDEGAKTAGSMNLSVSRNSVPEPGTLALVGASLFGFAALRRRKSA